MDAAYRKSLASAKPLKHDDAIEFHRRMKAGDLEARNRLVESLLRLVVKIATKFDWSAIPLDDLINEGNLYAMHAVDKWQPERGMLSTIASRCIYNGLLRYHKERHSQGVYALTKSARTAVLFSALPPHPEESYFDVADNREHCIAGHCLADVLSLMNNLARKTEKQIFRLRYEERLGYTEISKSLGIPSERCQSIMKRLVRKLCRVRECAFCGDKFVKNLTNIRFCSHRCERMNTRLYQRKWVRKKRHLELSQATCCV